MPSCSKTAGAPGKSRASCPTLSVRSIMEPPSLAFEASNHRHEAVELGLALEVGVGGHVRALAHGSAAVEDRLLDFLVLDGVLPLHVGVVARLRVQRGGAWSVALAR